MRIPLLAVRVVGTMALMAACFAIAPSAAQAQDLPGRIHLGMSPQELQQALPALQRVARPAHLAGGLVGAWSAPPVDIAGVALAPTFFFAGGQLQRVSYLAVQARPDAFERLLAWGRAQWGAELEAQNPEGRYASWTHDALDAYVQRSGATLRLVLKRGLVKDAGEL